MNKKVDKIYLYCCLGLLLLCAIVYKPMLDYFVAYGDGMNVAIGILFGILASIHFNVFWGVHGGVERFWGTVAVFSITATMIGGLFQGLEWIITHVTIAP